MFFFLNFNRLKYFDRVLIKFFHILSFSKAFNEVSHRALVIKLNFEMDIELPDKKTKISNGQCGF